MVIQPIVNDDWMDSYLMPGGTRAQAELTLKIKVYLKYHSATDLSYSGFRGRRVSVQTIAWDEESTLRWARELKNVVESGWNSKLWLVPSTDWRFNNQFDQRDSYQVPCIACKLEVIYVSRPSAHVIIDSYRLNDGDFARSGIEAPFSPASRLCSANGGETHGTLDTNDIKPKSNGQIPALHEFGHYIGLSHVNAQAARSQGISTNSRIAYGTGDQSRDLMGRGVEIVGWHGYPWCRRLRRHFADQQHPLGTNWEYVRGSIPTWITGTGGNRVSWQVTTQRRSHVTINNWDLYGRRTDYGDAIATGVGTTGILSIREGSRTQRSRRRR